MALLKKLKASTLMETLVATVLIVVVFMMASMTLNALFATTVQSNDDLARQELLFLQYRYGHGKLSLPYYDELDAWDIKVEERVWQGTEQVIFSAVNTSNDRELTFYAGHE